MRLECLEALKQEKNVWKHLNRGEMGELESEIPKKMCV